MRLSGAAAYVERLYWLELGHGGLTQRAEKVQKAIQKKSVIHIFKKLIWCLLP